MISAWPRSADIGSDQDDQVDNVNLSICAAFVEFTSTSCDRSVKTGIGVKGQAGVPEVLRPCRFQGRVHCLDQFDCEAAYWWKTQQTESIQSQIPCDRQPLFIHFAAVFNRFVLLQYKQENRARGEVRAEHAVAQCPLDFGNTGAPAWLRFR